MTELPAFPVGYRRLVPGEIIKQDDQYLSTSGHWERVPCWGMATIDNDVIWITRLMPYQLNCLLCEEGTQWHPTPPAFATSDLVDIQEHLMDAHGASQNDIRRQSSHSSADGSFVYILPDGREWLRAEPIVSG